MLRLVNTEEWVGARFEAPSHVEEHGNAAPHILMWLDAKQDMILGIDIVPANAPTGALATLLARTIRAPGAGIPRTPAVVRTENAREAEHLESRFPGIRVLVAATPELEVAKTRLDDFLGTTHGRSYNEDTYQNKDVSADKVARFFKSATELNQLAPWQHFEPEDHMEISIPALGIHKACILTIGQMNQDFWVLMFDSFRNLQAFFAYSSMVMSDPSAAKRPPLPVAILGINCEPAGALPPSMIQEAKDNKLDICRPENVSNDHKDN